MILDEHELCDEAARLAEEVKEIMLGEYPLAIEEVVLDDNQ